MEQHTPVAEVVVLVAIAIIEDPEDLAEVVLVQRFLAQVVLAGLILVVAEAVVRPEVLSQMEETADPELLLSGIRRNKEIIKWQILQKC
jgi:hypothetical protein